MKTLRRLRLAAACLGALLLSGVPGGAATYTDFNVPGARSTTLSDISNGVMTGFYQDEALTFHSFTYDGSLHLLADAPFSAASAGTSAYAISGTFVVGEAGSDSRSHAFILIDNSYVPLDNAAPNLSTTARGIEAGRVVGYYLDLQAQSHGFIFNGSSYVTVNDPLSTDGTTLNGISGNHIIGTSSARSFIYDGTTFVTIPKPAGSSDFLVLGIDGINLVGQYRDSQHELHGFFYNGSSYLTLDAPMPGATNTKINGIEGNTLTGSYNDQNGIAHGLIVIVPEPAGGALMAAALVVLIGTGRWRGEGAGFRI